MEFDDNITIYLTWLSEITGNWIKEILPISIFLSVSEIKINPCLFCSFLVTILAKKQWQRV